jgi:hypothetical protein
LPLRRGVEMGRRWERMVENPLKTAKKRVFEGFNCAIPTLASSAFSSVPRGFLEAQPPKCR